MSVASALESAVLVVTSGMGRPAPWRIWGLITWVGGEGSKGTRCMMRGVVGGKVSA